MIVAYVPDLMDRSKVAAAAPQPVQFVAAPADLVDAAGGADLVLVDLARPGVIEAVAAMAASAATSTSTPVHPRIVGFAPHVDHERFEQASAAGCTEVLARRDLFRRLDEVLAAVTPCDP